MKLGISSDWETTLAGHQVELKWRLKVFLSTSNLLFLNFTAPRYAFLFLNSETYIVHVINCERSRFVNFLLCMFHMWYKHVFFQHPSRAFASNFSRWLAPPIFFISFSTFSGKAFASGWPYSLSLSLSLLFSIIFACSFHRGYVYE